MRDSLPLGLRQHLFSGRQAQPQHGGDLRRPVVRVCERLDHRQHAPVATLRLPHHQMVLRVGGNLQRQLARVF